jgi:thioredoxin reductase (NADPH)
MTAAQDSIAFPKLNESQIESLARFSTCKSFQAGELLFAAGERDFKFFVVKHGEVEIVDRAFGHAKTVPVHGPG